MHRRMSPPTSNIDVVDPDMLFWGLSDVPRTILKSFWLEISQPTNSSIAAFYKDTVKIADGPAAAGRSKPTNRRAYDLETF